MMFRASHKRYLILCWILLIICISGNTATKAGAGRKALCDYPTRIACLAPHAAEILCDLGESDRIVAIGRLKKYDPFYNLLKDKPFVGGAYRSNINVEMVLGVNQDLGFCTEGSEDLFTSRGLKIYVARTYDVD